MNIHILKAINAINPEAQASVSNNDISTLVWENGTEPIPKEQVLSKQAELQAEYDAQDYARNRQAEYPSLDDLIVALWEGVVEERMASVTALEALRQAVKTKYPKP